MTLKLSGLRIFWTNVRLGILGLALNGAYELYDMEVVQFLVAFHKGHEYVVGEERLGVRHVSAHNT